MVCFLLLSTIATTIYYITKKKWVGIQQEQQRERERCQSWAAARITEERRHPTKEGGVEEEEEERGKDGWDGEGRGGRISNLILVTADYQTSYDLISLAHSLRPLPPLSPALRHCLSSFSLLTFVLLFPSLPRALIPLSFSSPNFLRYSFSFRLILPSFLSL